MGNIKLMNLALLEAKEAFKNNEVPIGAIGVYNHQVIFKAHNSVISNLDPTAHAEMLVLKEAGKILGNYRLNNLELYTTLEPCFMCYSAMVHARIKALYFGAFDEKGGIFSTGIFTQVKSTYNHDVIVHSGLLIGPCSKILKDFFKKRRDAGAVERGGLENR